MFNISGPEFLVLIAAGLFILGPERLPGAAAWLGRAARQARDYVNGAQQELTKDLGPEIDEIRKPLQELRQLRSLDPRRAIAQTLLDATGGYDPREDLNLKRYLDGPDKTNGGGGTNDTNGSGVAKPNSHALTQPPKSERPLGPDELPPFDSDAT
ncbi:MAG TPA: Sec-independent protein translocase protein TatB [Pseudonocardiaceae bacterium]